MLQASSLTPQNSVSDLQSLPSAGVSGEQAHMVPRPPAQPKPPSGSRSRRRVAVNTPGNRRSPDVRHKEPKQTEVPDTKSAGCQDVTMHGSHASDEGRARSELLRTARPMSAQVFDTEVQSLLDQLEQARSAGDGVKQCELCKLLRAALSRCQLLGRVSGSGLLRRRATVLRCLFKLLDTKNDRLLLRISSLILAVSSTRLCI